MKVCIERENRTTNVWIELSEDATLGSLMVCKVILEAQINEMKDKQEFLKGNCPKCNNHDDNIIDCDINVAYKKNKITTHRVCPDCGHKWRETEAYPGYNIYMILQESGEWYPLITTNEITTEYLGDHPDYENDPLYTGLVYTAKQYAQWKRSIRKPIPTDIISRNHS